MRKLLLSLLFVGSALLSFGQSTTNLSISTQGCQGDTLSLTFDVNSPFTVGNTFVVEITTTSTLNFNGNFVSAAPLLAYGVSAGNTIDVLIPDTLSQGLYAFRLVSSNPVRISDTLTNVIIGANPTTSITGYDFFDKAGDMTVCEGDTMLLVANPPPLGNTWTYQWLSNGTPIAMETDDTLMVAVTGTYGVEVNSSLCDATSNDTIVNTYNPTTDVFSNPNPDVTYIGNDSIRMCEGTVARLEYLNFPSPGIMGFTYDWLKADSLDIFGDTVWYSTGFTTDTIPVDTTSQWFLEVTSIPGGCVDTSSAFYVFVDTIPNTTISNQPWPNQALPTTTLCLTDSTLLTAADTVLNDSWEYQWQIAYPSGSGNWLSLTNDTLPWLTVDTSIVADTADYRLTLTNGSCDLITNEVTVEFVQFPTMTILPGDSIGVCEFDSTLVTLQSNALTFAWNGGLWVGIQNFLSTPGQYVIEAFGVNQCRIVDTLDLFNYSIVANATATPQTISPGESTTLSASGGSGYYWFADAPSYYSNQLGETTLAIPSTDTITYFIEVEDINGCTDTASVQVFVSEQDSSIINAEIFSNLQNVITPNGDGNNDVLDLSTITDGDDCEFTVYTRWGTPVFSQAIYDNAWGGATDGGEPLEDGTYYYVLTFDNAIRVKAAITILNHF